MNDLFPFVQVREDKAGYRHTGRYGIPECQGPEMVFHLLLFRIIKSPMDGIGGLVRGIVVRIDRGGYEVIRPVAVVFHFHPYRLDLFSGQVRPEDSLSFLSRRHGRCYANVVIVFRLRTIAEPHFVDRLRAKRRGRVIRRAAR